MNKEEAEVDNVEEEAAVADKFEVLLKSEVSRDFWLVSSDEPPVELDTCGPSEERETVCIWDDWSIEEEEDAEVDWKVDPDIVPEDGS